MSERSASYGVGMFGIGARYLLAFLLPSSLAVRVESGVIIIIHKPFAIAGKAKCRSLLYSILCRNSTSAGSGAAAA
jgi:hypothetical protein